MRKAIPILIVFFSVCFHSCTKDENEKVKFGWFKAYNKLYYDYYTATDTIKDCRFLYILPGNRFSEMDPSNSNSYEGLFGMITNKDFVAQKGGLYGIACENCDMGPLVCLNEFRFLYAPNAPSLNQELAEYGCSRTPRWYNRIVEVDKVVTVPMGTFKTYVMQHYFTGDLSYWNADKGLIRYDRYDGRGNLIGSLRLNRVMR